MVSGGYEDDQDYGDLIVYTGQGGNDPATKRQVADQQLVRGNAGLVKSCLEGLPVRVVRGRNPESVHAPAAGFRYDGVYFVEDYWQDHGKSGFLIWRYRLVSQARRGSAVLEEPGPAPKVRATVQRLVRSTAVVQQVKALYGNTCQVCGIPVAVPTGRYAEGAHIRPLGHPHDGPDVLANVLCLCPNDHVRFDYGAIWLDDHLSVVDAQRGQTGHRINVALRHKIGLEYVRYHRGLWQGERAR